MVLVIHEKISHCINHDFIFKFSFLRLQLETYGRKKNADKYCIDLASIEKDNNKRFYIRLRDYGKTDDYGENSSLIFVETNCENMESRFLKDVYFKDNMGMGEYITLDKKSDWMIFKSGSLGDKFNKFVCLQ